MKDTRSTGGVVINAETGLVLIVSQHGDSWSLPKGHVDPGEDDLTTARREIAEETGVTELTLLRTFPEYERHAIGYGGKGENWEEMKTIAMFLFITPQQALAPTDPDNPEARWVPREDVAGMLTHEKDREFFRSVLPLLP